MSLKGKKPTLIQKRLKAFFYGASGAGKTTAAIQFPKPYLIDTERGSENDQYVKMLDSKGGAIFQTTNFDELITEVKALISEKHEYKTLIIDPLTTLYNDLIEKAGLKVGTEFGRHYSEANRRVKHLIHLLFRLDMNVIITSHAKTEYGANLTVLGQTFDCYKKLDYSFDLVIEIQKRAKDRVALVKKTRIENFEEGEVFQFSYDEIAKRYGKEILEKDSVAIPLATSDQVKELTHLLETIKLPEDTLEKWLKKAEAESIEEFTEIEIQKCIEALKQKI